MIRDWKLGVLQKFIMGLIFIKILVLVMLKNCTHLLEVPVEGSARGQAQQPTIDDCNPLDVTCFSDFTPLSELKYCNQYDDSKDMGPPPRRLLPEEFIHKHGLPKADCVLWDAPTMTRGRSPVPGTLFIPTRILDYDQVEGCKLTKENGYKCHTKPWVRKDKKKHPKMTYVADVERFSILINQAFNAEIKGHEVQGRAADFDAYIHGQKTLNEDFKTKHTGYLEHMDEVEKTVKKTIIVPKKEDKKSLFPGAFSTHKGDVLQVQDILRLADARGVEMLDLVREDGTTMRSEGGVIDISIEYSNVKTFDPLGKTYPHYTITAKFLPMRYYKIAYESLTSEKERTMHNVHGLLILMRVHGTIRVWSTMHLLTVLTTAMVSLAMATTLTDYIMQYLFTFSGRYTILKFQPTQDYTQLGETLTQLKEAHKGDYNPKTHKAMPHADILNDWAEQGQKIPKDLNDEKTNKELLFILMKVEQRLNRLDGMDDHNAIVPETADDKDLDLGAAYIKKFEDKYLQQKLRPGNAAE